MMKYNGLAVISFSFFALVAESPILAQGLPVAEAEEVGMSSQRLERIRSLTQVYVDEEKLPGVSTLVARRGKVVHFEQVGMMDIEAGKKMLPDTIFRMYSMTKPITGVAVMILYEEGHFLLEDPVSKILPELKRLEVYLGGMDDSLRTEPAAEITIKHLLTHTSGLSYGGPEPGVPDIYRKSDIWKADSLKGFVERLAKLPLIAQPGTRWHYGVSMDVLARLVEVVSGLPFDRFLADRIFKPLGMADTAYYVPDEKIVRFAACYQKTSEGTLELIDAPQDSSFRNPNVVPYGGDGLVSTAADYLRFCQMLANGGELDGVRILGRKTAEFMMMDHMGPEFGREPLAEASGWWVPPTGQGFGFTGSVLRNVAQSSMLGSVGDFSWGGGAGTFFWIDREEQLIGIFMTQLRPPYAYPNRAQMKILTNQAVIE
jgi:CubicO group peptidase (beta-lactamase class C family)